MANVEGSSEMQYVTEAPIPVKDCLDLVDRVAGSQELRRAARLRGFLLYVAEQTLKNGSSGLHEQEIGVAVFGRQGSYDTGNDNIVRVNATELRKRLEHYFAGEGAAEPTIIEIPRGSYAPVFRRRKSETPSGSFFTAASLPSVADPTQISPAEAVSAAISKVDAPRALWPWQTGVAILLVLCAALAWRNRSLSNKTQLWMREPALHRFWGEFLGNAASGPGTDIVLADTSLALAEDMVQHNVALSEYVNFEYKRLAEEPSLSVEQRRALLLVLERNNGSVGDFRVAQHILMLDTQPARLNLKFAREYTADEARHHSVVLIGSRKSNPWVELFADHLNFNFEYDAARHRTFVVNRAPHTGEEKAYEATTGGEPSTVGYGVIACLPSLSGKGRALILEGTDSQATAATGEFVTNEDSFAAFQRNLPAGPMPFFEVLLRTSQLSGTPIHAEVIAYRVYPQ